MDGGNAVRFKLLAADGRSTAAIATTLVPELMTSERELRCLGSSLGLTALFVGCATPENEYRLSRDSALHSAIKSNCSIVLHVLPTFTIESSVIA